MRHRARPFSSGAAALAAASLLGSCGGSGASAPTAAAGGTSSSGGSQAGAAPSDAHAVLLSSVARTSSQSFHADLAMDVAMTPSGAAPGSTSPFGGGPTSVHMDMHLGVESEQRLQVTMTATVPGGHLSGQGVLVSGVLYLSTNGGNSWTSQPSDGSNFQYGPSEALQFMKAVGNVSDAGPGTVDGVSVEDYNATLDPAKMETAAGSVFSELGGGASGNAAVAQLLHSLNGVMRAAIDSAGRLVTEDCTANATLEFPSFGGSSASASGFSIHETVHGHFYDYGAAITVQAPRAARVHASSAPSPGSGSPFATVSSGLGN